MSHKAKLAALSCRYNVKTTIGQLKVFGTDGSIIYQGSSAVRYQKQIEDAYAQFIGDEVDPMSIAGIEVAPPEVQALEPPAKEDDEPVTDPSEETEADIALATEELSFEEEA